ncbi:MAG: MATE family efflux transporter [Prolixibacteraceae bacterium]|jgi:putative MATE family efflux protein|nr:MATE family efflux transporter [Prolixibacteraceae bacterium]
MKDFTEGRVGKLLIDFSVPLVAGNIFQNLYNVVDSIIVGNFIGKEALGAVGASFPIIFALISMVIGVGSGASTVVSQYFGAKQHENVKKTIDTIFIFFLVSSVLITVAGIMLSRPLFLLLNLPDEILPDALTYLRIYLMGTFFFFGFSGINSILRGLGDAKTPLYFMILATTTNIILDLVFVLVFKWGIEGVALATVFSHALAFFSSIVYLNKKHVLIRLSFRPYMFNRDIFRSCLRIGLPTGFQQSFVAIGVTAIMGIVNSFGTNAVAAYTAATRIDSFAKMPAMAFAQALASFTGQNLGAFKEKRARQGLSKTLMFSLSYCVIISFVIILFGNGIMKFFTPDPEVVKIGQDYLVIVSSFYLLFAVMFTIMGFLRGAGATLIPMINSFAALYLIRIPIAWFLSSEIGVNGIWWSEPAGWMVGMIILILYFYSGRWKGKSVVKNPDMPIIEE